MRNSYLSKFYWKIKQRRGSKKAVIALARKILVIIYNLLKDNTVYDESKSLLVAGEPHPFISMPLASQTG
jgi:hypothetical protein